MEIGCCFISRWMISADRFHSSSNLIKGDTKHVCCVAWRAVMNANALCGAENQIANEMVMVKMCSISTYLLFLVL